MNAKRVLLVIPAAVLPYVALAYLAILFGNSEIIGTVFGGNGFAFVWSFVAFCALAFAVTVTAVVLGLVKGWDATSLAKTVMIIKCVQILGYVAIFVLSVLLAMTIFTFVITILLAVIDVCCIMMTGLLGCVAAINGYRQGKCSKGTMIWAGILSFIYCADVVASVVFYAQLKKNTVAEVSL